VGETITFTAGGTTDSGGKEWVNCAETPIPPGGVEYHWTLTLPADYPQPLPPTSGTGSSVNVTALVAGTYTVSFSAQAIRTSCPPPDFNLGSASASTCIPGASVASQGQTCGLEVTLKEITFGDDYTMYEEAPPCDPSDPTKCWGDGPALTGPDWVSDNNPDHAVCYTRATAMRLTVKIEVMGSGGGSATLRVVGPDGVTGEGTFSVPCGTDERWVTITTGALPNVVKAYTPAGLAWSVKEPGGTTFYPIETTQHRIYVTLAAPTGSNPTNRRMNFVCYAAAQAADDGAATDGIHGALSGNPPMDGHNEPHLVDDWRLMAGFPYKGECDEQARFMILALRILGVLIGSDYLTYPSPAGDCDPSTPVEKTAANAGVTWDLDGDGTIGEEILILRFDFDGGTGSDINAFEGSVQFPTLGKYYAVWPNLSANSKCALLLKIRDEVGAVQCWAAMAVNEWMCITDPSTGALVTVPFPVCGAGCP